MQTRVIICKDSDATKYEVWKKIFGGVLDLQYIDIFDSINEAAHFCESNNFKIDNNYEEVKE